MNKDETRTANKLIKCDYKKVIDYQKVLRWDVIKKEEKFLWKTKRVHGMDRNKLE